MKKQVLVVVGFAALFAGCESGSKKDATATVEVDWNSDGLIDQVATLTYARKSGQLITQAIDYVDPSDDDITVTYDYDDNGFVMRETSATDSDDVAYFIMEMTNDERGNVIERRYDTNADGTFTYYAYFTYSADNDITREAYDFNGDGVINRERLVTYASAGQYATRNYDDNGDGVFNYFEAVSYAPGNRREILHELDRNADGSFDEQHFVTWTDNADGTITRFLERDLDLNGSIDRTDTRIMLTDDIREYLAKTVSYVRDTNNDGNPDYIELSTYNANEQILTSSGDTNGDGTPENFAEFDYDENGNLTGQRFYDAQGELTYIMNVVYKNWNIGRVELPQLSSST
ncbi:MAG: hypothetical protein AAF351_01890 [Pseudomonadota bacterium]